MGQCGGLQKCLEPGAVQPMKPLSEFQNESLTPRGTRLNTKQPREFQNERHVRKRGLVLRAARSHTAESEQMRIQKKLDAWASAAPSNFIPHLKAITPVLSWLLFISELVWPYIVMLVKFLIEVYAWLPTNILMALAGLVLCFFGGTFPTLIAALEAARVCGWDRTVSACRDLASEAAAVLEENKKDDLKEGAKMEGKKLIMHKTNLVMTHCHAEKVNTAISGLLTSWVAVEAVLRTEFTKTIALAVAIGDMVKKPLILIVAPVLVHIVPEAYHQWIPIALGWIAKSVGMSVAWYVQRLLSAVHSGLRGGLLFWQSLMAFLLARGWSLGFIPKDPDDTIIDDVLSWPLAAAGFYWQFEQNFHVPFPLDLVTWPLSTLELMLQWHITRK